MRVSIWRQFSSNNSSSFTVVGVFETAEGAQRAANEVRHMIRTIIDWWAQHPDEYDKYTWADEAPTPPEAELGQRLGFTWPGAVEWYKHASVEVVLNRLVYIRPKGFRPDTAGEPFDKVLTALGGRGMIDGDFYGDQIGTILVDITCVAPDEETAEHIADENLEYCCMVRHDGPRLHFYHWPLSEIDLPQFIDDLKAKGCTDITYELSASEGPSDLDHNPRDADLLIKLLQMPRGFDKHEIAQTLGEFRDRNAVAPLIEALRDGDYFVRSAAAWALGKIGDPRAVVALIAAFTDDEYFVRNAAARAVGKIGDRRAIEPLIALLSDDHIWTEVANSLGRIGEPARDKLNEAVQSTDPKIRERAVEALNRVIEARDFGPAFAALRDVDEDAQRKALEDIKRDPRAVEILIAILRNPPELEIRTAVVEALVEMGDPRAIDPIADHLLHLGGQGMTALEKFGAAAVELLMHVVRQPESWVRSSAVWSLGRLADPRSADLLLEVLLDPQWDSLTKQGAAQGLVQLGDVRAVQLLISLFAEFSDHWYPDPDNWVLGALRRLHGTAELVTLLLAEIEGDADLWTTIRNVAILGQLGDPRAVAPLLALRERSSPDIRRAVDAALLQLGYAD